MLVTLASSILDLRQSYRIFLDPITSKLSKGLLTLPDELISMIFRYTTIDAVDKQTTWLSHVSQRFRRITLAEPKLWATLYSSASLDQVSRCIRRSGDVDLRVEIKIASDYYGKNGHCRPFISAVIPAASRWRTITVDAELKEFEYESDTNVLVDLERMTAGLHLPRLEALQITHSGDRNHGIPLRASEFAPTWNAPYLHFLQWKNFLPRTKPAAQAFFAVRSFTVSLYGSDLIHALFVFLPSVPNLSDLNLEVKNGVYNHLQGRPQPATCSALKRFTLQIWPLTFLDNAAINILAPLLNSLHMPNVEHFSATVGLEPDHTFLSVPDLVTHMNPRLGAVVRSLLPDPHTHSHLTSLHLTMAFSLEPDTNLERLISSTTATIPLDNIPHVTALTLTTFSQVEFVRKHGWTEQHALRNLRLCSCEELDIGGLEHTVRSLLRAGAWDALERVEVEDCSLLEYEGVLEVVGAERLRFIDPPT